MRPAQRRALAVKTVEDERLHFFFEPAIGNPTQAIVKDTMLKNIREGLQEVKQANSNDKLAAKHSLLSMIVGENGELKKKGVASQILQVQTRNLTKAAIRRKRMSLSGANMWALAGRQPRSDMLANSTKELVTEFWLTHTKTSPKYRDVRKKRTLPIQFLDMPQVSLMPFDCLCCKLDTRLLLCTLHQFSNIELLYI